MAAMNAPTWTRITTEPDALGESPFWHPQEQRLYWVDIPGKRICRVAVDGLKASGPVAHWALDQEPGCIAPVHGGGLVMALRGGIYRAREWGGPLHKLADAPYDTDKQRFNDGKCDAQGRFWAGSLYEPKDQKRGALYMLDGWRGQTAADKWIDAKLDLIRRHKPFAWFGEAGVIQKAIEPMLTRRMRETQTFCRLEWVPSIHDKPTRARGFQARASMGLVILPQGPVGDAILDEYLRFPAGKHDDEVDCGGLIGRALDEAHPAIARPQDGARPVDRWTIARQRDAGTSGGWAA